MNYQGFKDHLTTFLWKTNDLDLIGSLDSLILMGEAGFNRSLQAEQRHETALITPASETEPLPDNYHEMRGVVFATDPQGSVEYVEPVQVFSQRSRTTSTRWLPIYSLQNRNIMLVGPVTNPTDVILDYTAKVPNFQTTDTSWLADDMLDILTYGTLIHTAPFLREDERVQLWSSLYQAALEEQNVNNAANKQRGVYRSKGLPQAASVVRKGDRLASKTSGY